MGWVDVCLFLLAATVLGRAQAAEVTSDYIESTSWFGSNKGSCIIDDKLFVASDQHITAINVTSWEIVAVSALSRDKTDYDTEIRGVMPNITHMCCVNWEGEDGYFLLSSWDQYDVFQVMATEIDGSTIMLDSPRNRLTVQSAGEAGTWRAMWVEEIATEATGIGTFGFLVIFYDLLQTNENFLIHYYTWADNSATFMHEKKYGNADLATTVVSSIGWWPQPARATTFFCVDVPNQIVAVEVKTDDDKGKYIKVKDPMQFGIGIYEVSFRRSDGNVVLASALGSVSFGMEVELIRDKEAEYSASVSTIFIEYDDLRAGGVDLERGPSYYLAATGGLSKRRSDLVEEQISATLPLPWASVPSPYGVDRTFALSLDTERDWGYFGFASARRLNARSRVCLISCFAYYFFADSSNYYTVNQNAWPTIGDGVGVANLTKYGVDSELSDSYMRCPTSGSCGLLSELVEGIADDVNDTFAILFKVRSLSSEVLTEKNIFSLQLNGTTGCPTGDQSDGVFSIQQHPTRDLSVSFLYSNLTRYPYTGCWENTLSVSNFFPAVGVDEIIWGAVVYDAGLLRVYKNGELMGTLTRHTQGVSLQIFDGESTDIKVDKMNTNEKDVSMDLGTGTATYKVLWFYESIQVMFVASHFYYSSLNLGHKVFLWLSRVYIPAERTQYFELSCYRWCEFAVSKKPQSEEVGSVDYKEWKAEDSNSIDVAEDSFDAPGPGFYDLIFSAASAHNGKFNSKLQWSTDGTNYEDIPAENLFCGFGLTHTLVRYTRSSPKGVWPVFDLADADITEVVVDEGYYREGLVADAGGLATSKFMEHFSGYIEVVEVDDDGYWFYGASCWGIVIQVDGYTVYNYPWDDTNDYHNGYDSSKMCVVMAEYATNILLDAGLHKIDIWYMQHTDEITSLKVYWESDNIIWKPKPPDCYLYPLDSTLKDAWGDLKGDFRFEVASLIGAGGYDWAGDVFQIGVFTEMSLQRMKVLQQTDGCYASDMHPELHASQAFERFRLSNCSAYVTCVECNGDTADETCQWCPSDPPRCMAVASECEMPLSTVCPAITSVSPSAGAATGGYNMTVEGLLFFEGMQLRFGKQAWVPYADIHLGGSTFLWLIVPDLTNGSSSYPGSVDIVFLTADGQDYATGYPFTLITCSESYRAAPCGFCVNTLLWGVVASCDEEYFVLGDRPTLTSITSPASQSVPVADNVTVELEGKYLSWSDAIRCRFEVVAQGVAYSPAEVLSATSVRCASPLGFTCLEKLSGTVTLEREDSGSGWMSLTPETRDIEWYNCSYYSGDCATCGSSSTPSCGFCLVSAKCLTWSECAARPGGFNPSNWGRNGLNGFACPLFSEVSPSSGPSEGFTDVTVTLATGWFVTEVDLFCFFKSGAQEFRALAGPDGGSTQIVHCNTTGALAQFPATPTATSVSIVTATDTDYMQSAFAFEFYECGSFSTCGTCQHPSHPVCGWCFKEGVCTAAVLCEDSDWFNRAEGCPSLVAAQTLSAPENATKTVVLAGSVFVPGLLTCRFTEDGLPAHFVSSTVVSVVGVSGLQCEIPALSPKGSYTVEVYYLASVTGELYATGSATLTVFSCGDASSCSECVGASYTGCGWDRQTMKCLPPQDPALPYWGTNATVQCPTIVSWAPQSIFNGTEVDVDVVLSWAPPAGLTYSWVDASSGVPIAELGIPVVNGAVLTLHTPALVANSAPSTWNLWFNTSVGALYLKAVDFDVYVCAALPVSMCASCVLGHPACYWCDGSSCSLFGACGGTASQSCPRIADLYPGEANCLDSGAFRLWAGTTGYFVNDTDNYCGFTFTAQDSGDEVVEYYNATAVAGNGTWVECPFPPDPKALHGGNGNVNYHVAIYRPGIIPEELFSLNEADPKVFSTYECNHLGGAEFVTYESCVTEAKSDCVWKAAEGLCSYDSSPSPVHDPPPYFAGLVPSRGPVTGKQRIVVSGSNLTVNNLYVEFGTNPLNPALAKQAKIYNESEVLYVDAPQYFVSDNVTHGHRIRLVRKLSDGSFVAFSSPSQPDVFFAYFDCSTGAAAASCGTCVVSEVDCGWCWDPVGGSQCCTKSQCGNNTFVVAGGQLPCANMTALSTTVALTGAYFSFVVSGEGFVDKATEHYKCQLGTVKSWSVSAVSNTSLTCNMNSTSESQDVQVLVSYGGTVLPWPDAELFSIVNCASTTSCTACLSLSQCGWCFDAPGSCTGAAACAGSWNSSAGMCPEFSSISPKSGAMAGGTNVTLTGKNFFDGIALKCSIEGKRVNATYVDSETVVCQMPSSAQGGAEHSSTLYLYYDVPGQSWEYDRYITPAEREASMRYTYYPCEGVKCADCAPDNRPECGWCATQSGGVTYSCVTVAECSGPTQNFTTTCPSFLSLSPSSAPVHAVGAAASIEVVAYGHVFPATLFVYFGSTFYSSCVANTSDYAFAMTPTDAGLYAAGNMVYDARLYLDSTGDTMFVPSIVKFMFYDCESSVVKSSMSICIDATAQTAAFGGFKLGQCGWCLSKSSCMLRADPNNACAPAWWLEDGGGVPALVAGSLSLVAGAMTGGDAISFKALNLVNATYWVQFGEVDGVVVTESRLITVPATVTETATPGQFLVECVTPVYNYLMSADSRTVALKLMVGVADNDTKLVAEAGMEVSFEFYDCTKVSTCGECSQRANTTDNPRPWKSCGWCVLRAQCCASVACPVQSQPWVKSGEECPTLLGVTPGEGSTYGGTQLVITGHHLADPGNLTCKFAFGSTPATVNGTTLIFCDTPAQDSRRLSGIRLVSSDTGRQFSDNSLVFKFYDCQANIRLCASCIHPERPECGYCRNQTSCCTSKTCDMEYFVNDTVSCPFISVITPTQGATYGGTVVVVKGFDLVEDLACLFNETRVSTTYLDSTTLSCKSPNDSSGGEVKFGVQGYNQDTSTWQYYSASTLSFGFYDCGSYTSCESCADPSHPECVWWGEEYLCTVASVITGTAFASADACPRLTSVDPREGLVEGGDEVSVHATIFVSGVSYSCRFGGRSRGASYESSSTLKCDVPEGSGEGKVDLEILQAGKPYTSNSLAFFYVVEKKSTPVGAIVAGVVVPLWFLVGSTGYLISHTLCLMWLVVGFLCTGKCLRKGHKWRKRRKFRKLLKPPDFQAICFKNETDLRFDISSREHLLDQVDDVVRKTDIKFAMCVTGATESADSDKMAKYLMYMFERHGEGSKLLKAVVRREVETTQDPNTLFRTNSLATKLFKAYSQFYGLEYLFDTFAKPILLLSLEHKDEKKDDKRLASFSQVGASTEVEVDPSKMADGDETVDSETKENLSKFSLLLSCQEFLTTITRSSNNVPARLKDVLATVKEDVQARFEEPSVAKIAIGGFFFLRFLCPAIMTPESHGLLKELPSAKLRRHLTLIAKVLQNLANGVQFCKEPYMMKMNDFISSNMNSIQNFFLRLATVPVESKPEKIRPIPENAHVNAICFVYNFLLERKAKIVAQAEQFNDPAFSELLTAYLDMLLGKVGGRFERKKN